MNLASRHWLSAILLALLAFLLWSAFAGMTSEEVKAFEGYKTKAENGDASAQYILGDCYASGKGVARDLSEAVKWYRKAADQGNAEAQSLLGDCYTIGRGVAPDSVEAYAYYNLAGRTDEDARKMLAVLEKILSPRDRLRGQQRTKELQKEIEAKIAAKKAEDEKKSGK